ncbi:hypothetical protein E2C01_059605 [Portunus trituberculatus]|uniref:Uncharacterized protein n=1 Tax=Portunus trituberculatus TaxID=210409 RepID=A0A5B7GZM9_PORTR|nr:hypothetical protein [Portunus trituberculatus]
MPLWPARNTRELGVSWTPSPDTHLARILETQPLDTCRMREMSHERTPEWAISTILWRMWSGSGRPLTYTPPIWFTPVPPARILHQYALARRPHSPVASPAQHDIMRET